MTYFMRFDESMKAIRPSDNTRLRMPTDTGDVEVHVYEAKHRSGGASLVGVPRTAENLAVLGLPANTGKQSPWIIPPFPLLKSAFRKGGPFIRDGKIEHIPDGFDPQKVVVGGEQYRPGPPAYIPYELKDDIPLNVESVDPTDWDIEMWVGGSATRAATEEERSYQLIPWTYYPLGFLDLWLEQYRCYHLDQDIPAELSPPDEDIDHDAEESETPTGLKMRKVELDASTGELEGQHTVYIQVLVDTELDHAITATGHEANGYFLEGLACYLQSADRIDPSLQLDPEGEGIGIYGNPAHVEKAQTAFRRIAETPSKIAGLVEQAEAAGIEFDD
ncbi:hypothetical protein [Corynebacterium fournieri]|uniref:hypothetical protein n=1 Tax=Corynebacterium fournieri TaxID=1852390 RepID=UPI000A2F2D43|nr:hypothetical protein [Corynebacterium fournieri]WJY97872.1 hypothetical protein CFOUR_07325 [Corynebacterium fournieri]